MLAEPSAFMAFSGIRKEQNRDDATIKVAPSDANVSKDEATRRTIDNTMTTFTSASNEKATAPESNAITGTPSAETTIAADKPIVYISSRPKANLMDLDIGQETTQPVLQFTAPRVEKQPSSSLDQHIEALTKSDLLSPAQVEILKSIRAQLRDRENAKPLVSEAARPETYTRSELESLRPKAVAPKATTGVAKKFAEERDAFFIGEHVYKNKYLTSASLTEEFQKLTISDKTPIKATAASIPKFENPDNKPISDEKEKSKTNPFGPPPDKREIPFLPVHPLAQSVIADHTAATRNQYAGIGPSSDKGKGPSLPAHLLVQSTTTDHGAAVRNQYLGVGRSSDNGKNPSLSARLLAQSATADHGAAARNQYSGGNAILTSTSNQQSAEDTTLSMRPTRRNKINETGFYALTENRVPSVAAGKKGEDPLLVARKRGL